MVGSTSPESLQKHRKIVINTKQNVVFHGERPLPERISTQKLIRVALEWPQGGLPDATGARGRGAPHQKIDINMSIQSSDFLVHKFLKHEMGCSNLCACVPAVNPSDSRLQHGNDRRLRFLMSFSSVT